MSEMDDWPEIESGEKQPRKQLGGVTGKGFVPGDSRINRMVPGPGRPKSEVKERLGRERDRNIDVLCELRDSAKAERVRLEATRTLLEYDLGRPVTVVDTETGEELRIVVTTPSGADPWVDRP